MILDNNLIFSNNQAITVTADSTTVLDTLQGILENIGNGTVFGSELGFGDGVAIPKIAALVTTAFVSGGGATLQVAFAGSTDSSTWTTYVESPAATFTAANLVVGRWIARWDWPIRTSGAALPRYFKLIYTVATSTFSAGKIFAGIALSREDHVYYPSGFSVV